MAKMKLKTHSGAKKRFKLTKNGKIKRGHAFRSHILTKKTTKLTRGYRQPSYVIRPTQLPSRACCPTPKSEPQVHKTFYEILKEI